MLGIALLLSVIGHVLFLFFVCAKKKLRETRSHFVVEDDRLRQGPLPRRQHDRSVIAIPFREYAITQVSSHFRVFAFMMSASTTADMVVPFASESSRFRASADSVNSTPFRFRLSRGVEYHSESVGLLVMMRKLARSGQ